MRSSWELPLWVVVFTAMMGLFACTAGPVEEGRTRISGAVEPLRGGSLVARALVDGVPAERELATADMDETGAFTLELPAYAGAILLETRGGGVVDPVTGEAHPSGAPLRNLLPDVSPNQSYEHVGINVATTLGVAFSLHHARARPLADAWNEAMGHLNAHLLGVSWTDAEAQHSPLAVLATSAMFFAAKALTENGKLSYGPSTDGLALTSALGEDGSDGTWDGLRGSAALAHGGVKLSREVMREGLGRALVAAADSPSDASGLERGDALVHAAAVASDADPYLFCEGQLPAADCAPPPVDFQPPSLVFVSPAAGAGVRGTVAVDVKATDDSGIATLELTGLKDAALTPDGALKAMLHHELDVSALPDGPLTLEARATDTAGNEARLSLDIQVANKAPLINIDAPSEGAVVEGVVTVFASAVAQNGTVTGLEVVDGPEGFGADALPEAGVFSAKWDTSKTKEGSCLLTFRAHDSFGGVTDSSVVVTVDNHPPGTVTAHVFAGSPVPGSNVSVYAVDDATGLDASREGGALLGHGGPTDAEGVATFELSEENWEGPVRIVVTGAGLSYVDPSDGTTSINLPASFALTSLIPSYRSGDSLEAPVTYWTTLADAAARAAAAGLNKNVSGPSKLSEAQKLTDPLFAAHIVTQPWALRTAVPVSLSQPPTQTLRDSVYAALGDVALNALARRMSVKAGLPPGTAFTAPSLVMALQKDLADGQFDGHASGAAIPVPTVLDADTTRLELALALDAFAEGPSNSSGLNRASLMGAGIYDAMALDISALYPATSLPTAFDASPPTVNFTVAYPGIAGPQGPKGPSGRVRGLLNVVADATDVTGVQSLSVTMDGVPLPLTPQASTTAHVAGTWHSGNDGPLTVTATATDVLGNTGTTAVQLEVDNTAPTISLAAPMPAYFSQALVLDASATDNGALDSFVPTLAGFVDQDAAPGRIFGTWTPSSEPDGPIAIELLACDDVGNCAASKQAPVLDRTPPTLSISTPPPAYTKAATITLTVKAQDAGAGVAQVKAQAGSASAISGVDLGQGNFSLTVPLLVGPNTLVVWAEDATVPANSGHTKGAPWELAFTVVRDVSSPTATLAPIPAYFPESALDFQRKPDGSPVMPPVWTYGSASKADLASVTDVHKSAARLSWGTPQPTAAALESTNVANVPFLQVQVPFNPLTDAPLKNPSFKLAINNCPSCTTTQSTGTPLPSSKSAPNLLFFDVPLALETLPQLVKAQSFLSVSVTFTVEDEAGNVGASFLGTWNVYVEAPPLALVEDTAYKTRGDLKSPFAYSRANQTYDDLWSPANAAFAADNALRLVRYVVYNPSPVTAGFYGVAASGSGALVMQESWGSLAYPYPGADYTLDGFSFRAAPQWDSAPYSTFATYCGPTAPDYYPCGAGKRDTTFPYHVLGSGSQFVCQSQPLPPYAPSWAPVASTGLLLFRAFVPALPGGNETAAASNLGLKYVVPGASSTTTAGTAAFYVAVARPTQRSRPLNWGTNPYDPTLRYQYWYADFWKYDQPGYCCSSFSDRCLMRYQTYRWFEYLDGASTSLQGGALDVFTGGVTTDATGAFVPVGPTQKKYPALPFSVSFTH